MSSKIREIPKILYKNENNEREITIKEEKGFLEFYINDNIQWNTSDEFIYHEILVLPYINYLINKKKKLNILILGGGDGLVVRELMKYDKYIKKIKLTDIDNEIIKIHKEIVYIRILNNNSLNYKKLEIINMDAFKYVKETNEKYDLIISDLIDPNEKYDFLYSKEMFKNMQRINKGLIIYQNGDIFYENKTNKEIRKKTKKIFKSKIKNIYFPIPNFGYYNFLIISNKKIKKLKGKIFKQKLLKTKQNQFLKTKKILKTIKEYKNIYNKKTKTIKWMQDGKK